MVLNWLALPVEFDNPQHAKDLARCMGMRGVKIVPYEWATNRFIYGRGKGFLCRNLDGTIHEDQKLKAVQS